MSKKTICVLDDEILAATSIRDLLNDLGFRVLPYFRADTFIDELPNLNVDLLITDYYLNDGAKGIGLCRAIRSSERHARVPILIISGADDPALRAECLAAGASAFLGKPLFLSDLREAIAKLIGPIQ
ncbi:MAG: response regulator, partial [Bdellovibrionales bacterium]|nr:response regulator [Bdellovibrionales bacterium]